MIVRRYISAATVACFTLTLSGSAFAANVTFDTTGADSNQKVVINDSSDYAAVNVNNATTVNTNVQEATTGNVSADKNTSVGTGVGSGDAMNNNGTATTIGETNTGTGIPVVQTGAVAGQGVSAGTRATGSVLGAATMAGGLGASVATLPVTGPSVPVDVSALRAAWNNNQVTAPTVTLAKTSHMFTGAMLVTATLLSIIGALGSAWYARRREERV